ncbi:MAG: PAS domain S-box protein [Chloroflexota bacterium]
MNDPIRVLLVDDSPYFLEAARDFLQYQESLAVVGIATEGDEALVQSRDLQPDIILLDLNLTHGSGLHLIPLLKENLAGTKIIVLTMMEETSYRAAALQAGADGFVHKSSMSKTLVSAILDAMKRADPAQAADHHPTDRQVDPHEARFLRLAEHLPDLIYRYEISPKRGFSYVGPSAAAMTGYTSEEHYADPDLGFKLVHPDDRPILEATAQGKIEPGQPIVLRWVRKDGRIIWTEQRNVSIFNEAGELTALEGIARDITERKQAEKTLRRVERRSQALIEKAPDGIVLIGPDGRMVFASPAAKRMFGYEGKDEVGLNPAEFTHPEDLGMVLTTLSELIQDPSLTPTLQYRFRHSNGNWRWVESTFTNMFGDESINAIVINFRDITERRLAEEKVLSLARFPSENPGPILRLASNGVILYANPASDSLLRKWGCGVGENAPLFWQQKVVEALTSRKSETVDVPCGKLTYSMFIAPIVEEAYVNLYGRDITERQQAEEALRKAEAKYRNIFENATEAITQTTPGGQFITANPAAARILGYESPEELIASVTDIGRQFYVQPGRRGEFMRLMEENERVIGFESEVYRKDGTIVWFSENSRAVRDEQGNLLYFEGTTEDVTARRRAEEAMHKAEEKYRNIFENAMDAITQTTPDGRYITANPAAARMLGYDSPEELISSLADLDHRFYVEPGRRKEFIRLMEQSATVTGFESEVYRKDGSTIWISESSQAIHDDQGNLLRYEGTAEDITARMRAEQALTESEARYRSLIDQIPAIVYLHDVQSEPARTEFISPRVRDILGYSPEEWMAGGLELWEKSIHPDDRDRVVEQYRASTRIDALYSQEYRMITRDRRTIWVHDTATIQRDEQGRPINMQGIAYDMTADKRTEATMRLQSAALEAAANAIVITNVDGIIQWVNPAYTQLTGYSLEEATGQNPRILWSGVQDQAFYQDLWDTILAGRVWQGELTNKHKDGALYNEEQIITPLSDASGRITHFIGVKQDITRRKRNEANIARRVVELEALHQSGIAFSQTLDQRDIGEKVIEVLSGRLDWHHAAVRVRRADSDEVELIAYIHPDEKPDSRLRLNSAVTHVGEGLTGWVIQHGKPLHINNLSTDPRYVETFDGMKSGLYAPMRIHSTILGCISVESDQTDAFSEEDLRLLMTLATQAAAAIQNARLFEAMQLELNRRTKAEEKNREQLSRLTALREIDQAINSSFDVNISLHVLLSQTVKQLGVDAATVLRYDPDVNTLKYAAGLGFRSGAVQMESINLTSSYAGRAVLERRVVQLPDLAAAEENLFAAGSLQKEGFAGYFGAPLVVKDNVIGVLEVFQRSIVARDDEWLDFFKTLAGQAAIAMDNGQLFEKLHRTNYELMQAYDATIEGWSRAMDLRDKETEGHSQRVTDMSLRLARLMGVQENEIIHIRRGALLHDIGKMGVPDPILLKADKLSEEEWAIMRKHPEFAHEMLSPIRFLRAALDIPYCHHEKWDGSGYPRGLRGGQIPLAARVFAVVDVWDALTSDRPYRPAWSRETALEYIRQQTGKHFDPQVVDIFLRMMADR